MVVPRVERRGAAGLVATTATRDGMTATDESLARGAARTALITGVPVSLRFGADAVRDLGIVLGEGLTADRVVVGGLDRRDAVAAGAPLAVARRGAYVALDHVGVDDDEHISDHERAALVIALVEAGHADRILLSSNAIGVAKGHPDHDLPYGYVVSSFVPLAQSLGLSDDDARRILVDNPRELLSVH
jgi:phosphotriesterase-related protein